MFRNCCFAVMLQVAVTSIIQCNDDGSLPPDCTYADEVDDPAVDYMVQYIQEGFTFNRGMFSGGAEGLAHPILQPSKKAAGNKRKGKPPVHGRDKASPSVMRRKKAKVGRPKGNNSATPEADIIELVDDHIKDAITKVERSLKGEISSAMKRFVEQCTSELKVSMEKLITKEADSVIGTVLQDINMHQKNEQIVSAPAAEVSIYSQHLFTLELKL